MSVAEALPFVFLSIWSISPQREEWGLHVGKIAMLRFIESLLTKSLGNDEWGTYRCEGCGKIQKRDLAHRPHARGVTGCPFRQVE